MRCERKPTFMRAIRVLAGLLLIAFTPQAYGLAGLDEEIAGRLADVRRLIETARYREADTLAADLLEEVEAAYGVGALEAAQVLDLIVEARLWGGKPRDAEARRFAERAVEIRESALGPEHPEVARSLWKLGYYLLAGADYEEATEVLGQALTIAEAALGPEHPDVARILSVQGRVYNGLGLFSDAKACLERALAIQEKTVGEDHEDTARTLDWLCWYYQFVQDPENAIRAGERAIAIYRKIFPPNNHHMGRTLNALAGAYSAADDHDHAWDLYQQALGIYRQILDPDHTDIGYIMYNLGEIKWLRGELDESRTYYEEGLAIIEKTYGPEYEDVAYALLNLGQIEHARGDYAAARSLTERALTIYERLFGADSPRVAVPWQRLARILVDMGEYAEARQIYERSLSTLEEALGPDNPQVAVGRVNMANLMSSLGDYAGAKAGIEQALAVYEKALGLEHPGTGYIHNHLGWVLLRLGELDLAGKSFEQALAIHEKALGPAHVSIAYDLTGLSVVYAYTGLHEEATSSLERALAIMEKAEGRTAPGTAMLLHNLAIARRNAGDPEGALEIYDRAIPLTEQIYGLDHPKRARLLYNCAIVLAETGRWSEALKIALQVEEISSEHLRLTSRRFAEKEALRYAAVRISGLDLAVSLAAELNDPDATRQAWDALIRSRALVLDEIAARHRTVTDISRLAEDLVVASERLAKLMVRGSEGDPPERYNRMLEEARSQKDRAERALAERSAGFREDQRRSRATLRDAVANLPLRSALVSFVRYDRHETDPSMAHTPGHRPIVTPSYLALIQRRDEPEPIVVDLGSAEDIEDFVSQWRREFEPGQVRVEPAYQMIGDALRQKVWDPVATHLERIEQVLIVPDGAINLMSFAALPAEPDGYVLDKGPIIHYVSAERDLVPSEIPPIEGEGLLALGGPDYGAEVEVAALGTSTSFRGERSACADFADLRFAPLEGAATEADEIASLWSDTFGASEVVHLSGGEAGEAALKARASGKRVLHLATHGFFMGNCASALEAYPGYDEAVPAQHQAPPVHGENPLVLAGLALAGANRRALAGPDMEDGILTAEEIGALDLSSVEVAVLSACDTGVGEIRAGEGVFGLRRAFHVAGARTLVMSLWPVDDESTREWMRAFYEKWLTDGLSKAEALREASLAVLQARRDQGESEHPFYWGAFVAAGDWR